MNWVRDTDYDGDRCGPPSTKIHAPRSDRSKISVKDVDGHGEVTGDNTRDYCWKVAP